MKRAVLILSLVAAIGLLASGGLLFYWSRPLPSVVGMWKAENGSGAEYYLSFRVDGTVVSWQRERSPHGLIELGPAEYSYELVNRETVVIFHPSFPAKKAALGELTLLSNDEMMQPGNSAWLERANATAGLFGAFGRRFAAHSDVVYRRSAN